MNKLERLENAKKLVGQEMSFMELDNKMMEIGFHSLYDDGVEENCKQDGNTVFTSVERGECEVQVPFNITADCGEDEDARAFYLKVTKVEEFCNTGTSNIGNRNTGDYNSGNWNSGDRNTGMYNSGESNTGNCNTGDRNAGEFNSGNYNSGNYNSGYCNTTTQKSECLTTKQI